MKSPLEYKGNIKNQQKEVKILNPLLSHSNKSKDDVLSLFAGKLYEVTARLEESKRKKKYEYDFYYYFSTGNKDFNLL